MKHEGWLRSRGGTCSLPEVGGDDARDAHRHRRPRSLSPPPTDSGLGLQVKVLNAFHVLLALDFR